MDCKEQDLEKLRRLIVQHIKKGRRKVQTFTYKTPTEWCPRSVIVPIIGGPYTDPQAWGLICDAIEDGVPMKAVAMRSLKGKIAYELVIQRQNNCSAIYAKVQLIGDAVIGWSFHEDKPPKGKRKD